MADLSQGLEELEEPVVLVIFGDHKPWAGNGNSVYTELNADFDLSTLEGFSQYYATPYIIWANSAAREILGQSFRGNGKTVSPCFLMPELFDLCGWEGPGFMKLSRQLRNATPLVHSTNRFLTPEGALTNQPPDPEFYQSFLQMQYYREQKGRDIPTER